MSKVHNHNEEAKIEHNHSHEKQCCCCHEHNKNSCDNQKEEQHHGCGCGHDHEHGGHIEGKEIGIKAFVIDYLEEGVSKERIIEKLQRRFSLETEVAEMYFEKFSAEIDE